MTTRRNAIESLVAIGLMAAAQGTGSAATPAETTMGDKRIMRRKVGPIAQHGYVVTDAAKTAMQWARRVGVGPFYQFDQPIDDYVFRGKPVNLRIKTAVSYWHDIQIELIQQVSPEESLYTEALRTAPNKLNHYATLVPDIDAGVTALDAEKYVVHRGGTAGGLKFVYLEKYLPDGSHLELMQVPAANLVAFDGMKAVCQAWDGTKPLRTMAELMTDLGALSKSAPPR